ncbi:hypothetical protein Thiowin_03347 [Thiorhodovibrio winogradskyi]|uniref:Uncharacterized protein n=1 Tax=Thiorhodovibrio winogradskyi TaxID=77007 RepID=A0ABZ0SE07_9GAMM
MDISLSFYFIPIIFGEDRENEIKHGLVFAIDTMTAYHMIRHAVNIFYKGNTADPIIGFKYLNFMLALK